MVQPSRAALARGVKLWQRTVENRVCGRWGSGIFCREQRAANLDISDNLDYFIP